MGKTARKLGLGLAALPLVALAAAYLVPLPARLSAPVSTLVLDRDEHWMRVHVTRDGGGMVRIPVRRDELPERLVEAVLDFEDRRYAWHLGVDPLAIARAAWLNLTTGRVVSGGSTITMQVARMLERRPRTLSAKLVEMARAVQLELRYSKDEILELYFNLAPYGGNLEGVGAAAYYYFEKPVSRLSLDEAATLAALPNSPTVLAPGRGRDKLAKRRNDVLARMAANGVVTADEAERAMHTPVTAARRTAPFVAPHLAEKVRQLHPGRPRLHTTIERELQLRAEKLLTDHVDRLTAHGITNGALVIIDNETRKVRAYVGSRAFFDAASQGQVDGADALRSPGSTLKPFVYALGLERGVIGMNTLLEDVPLRYKDWEPSNFDGKWHGMVAAKDALAQSLNIPAVKVAQAVEPRGLVELLRLAGVRAVKADPTKYGLASVLGGVDLSLLELTNLYATLARGGLHRGYKLLEDDPDGPEVRLYSPEAAYSVTEILTDVRRPELPESWRDAVALPRVAWKTGTSYGRRDAWAVGVTRRWSVGVWVGNFDGRGVPELVGVESAAPLLFALLPLLPGVATDPWIDQPPGLVRREVCALSGARPGPGCAHVTTELALPQAPAAPCALHVVLDIDDDSGLRLCSRCRAGHRHHPETFVAWPASVVGHLREAGVMAAPLPAHNPACAHGLGGEPPVIRAPNDGDEFVIRPGVPLEHQQIALIGSAAGGGPLFWFVDDALQAQTEGGSAVMLDPVHGTHRLVAVDAEGRRSSVSIRVRAAE